MLATAVWPWRGLGWLLLRPWLWWWPMLAQAALIAAVVSVGLGVGGAVWAGQTASWWWLWAMTSIAAGISAMAVAWLFAAPIITGYVLDRLAAEVYREHGVAVESCSLPRSLLHTVRMLVATLPSRLLWAVVIVSGLLSGPFSPLITSYALARISVLDAFDGALAAQCADHAHRRRGLEQHQMDRVAGALGAMAMAWLLALPVVGMLLWMPGLVCGAALRVVDERRRA